jgi:hypothetical protein
VSQGEASTVEAVAATRGAPHYLELTKPRITSMVVLTAFVGYAVASTGSLLTERLVAALVGTALVAAGASCLNMLLERRTDSLMLRTRNRPLPAGRLRPVEALAWGLALTTTGLALLTWRTGALPAAVAFVTWASYLFFYTPLKTRTSLSTIVGALPGALPPVIGWAAARGRLERARSSLRHRVPVWQIPRFWPSPGSTGRTTRARACPCCRCWIATAGSPAARRWPTRWRCSSSASLPPPPGSRAGLTLVGPGLGLGFIAAPSRRRPAHTGGGALALRRLDPLPHRDLRAAAGRPPLKRAEGLTALRLLR